MLRKNKYCHIRDDSIFTIEGVTVRICYTMDKLKSYSLHVLKITVRMC